MMAEEPRAARARRRPTAARPAASPRRSCCSYWANAGVATSVLPASVVAVAQSGLRRAGSCQFEPPPNRSGHHDSSTPNRTHAAAMPVAVRLSARRYGIRGLRITTTHRHSAARRHSEGSGPDDVALERTCAGGVVLARRPGAACRARHRRRVLGAHGRSQPRTVREPESRGPRGRRPGQRGRQPLDAARSACGLERDARAPDDGGAGARDVRARGRRRDGGAGRVRPARAVRRPCPTYRRSATRSSPTLRC